MITSALIWGLRMGLGAMAAKGLAKKTALSGVVAVGVAEIFTWGQQMLFGADSVLSEDQTEALGQAAVIGGHLVDAASRGELLNVEAIDKELNRPGLGLYLVIDLEQQRMWLTNRYRSFKSVNAAYRRGQRKGRYQGRKQIETTANILKD